MVTTVCYGDKEVWKSREEAKEFFFKGMVQCDGCEAERYMKIYSELEMGLNYCTDDLDMFGDYKMAGNDLEAMLAQWT